MHKTDHNAGCMEKVRATPGYAPKCEKSGNSGFGHGQFSAMKVLYEAKDAPI